MSDLGMPQYNRIFQPYEYHVVVNQWSTELIVSVFAALLAVFFVVRLWRGLRLDAFERAIRTLRDEPASRLSAPPCPALPRAKRLQLSLLPMTLLSVAAAMLIAETQRPGELSRSVTWLLFTVVSAWLGATRWRHHRGLGPLKNEVAGGAVYAALVSLGLWGFYLAVDSIHAPAFRRMPVRYATLLWWTGAGSFVGAWIGAFRANRRAHSVRAVEASEDRATLEADDVVLQNDGNSLDRAERKRRHRRRGWSLVCVGCMASLLFHLAAAPQFNRLSLVRTYWNGRWWRTSAPSRSLVLTMPDAQSQVADGAGYMSGIGWKVNVLSPPAASPDVDLVLTGTVSPTTTIDKAAALQFWASKIRGVPGSELAAADSQGGTTALPIDDRIAQYELGYRMQTEAGGGQDKSTIPEMDVVRSALAQLDISVPKDNVLPWSLASGVRGGAVDSVEVVQGPRKSYRVAFADGSQLLLEIVNGYILASWLDSSGAKRTTQRLALAATDQPAKDPLPDVEPLLTLTVTPDIVFGEEEPPLPAIETANESVTASQSGPVANAAEAGSSARRPIPLPGPLTHGDVEVRDFPPPTDDEVIRTLDKVNEGRNKDSSIQRNNVRIVKDRIADYIDPPRFVPLIGRAQLHHAHFKCTIYFDEVIPDPTGANTSVTKPRVEVLYIDMNHYEVLDDGLSSKNP